MDETIRTIEFDRFEFMASVSHGNLIGVKIVPADGNLAPFVIPFSVEAADSMGKGLLLHSYVIRNGG
ncbi:hypothetical protein [Mycolicibacterium elephantis]|uniref:Uncharacterized protein n=1 Tax=Mycolicibacterium elephantis DSM 44368 TaxID=1335622 RepID=A0A439DYF3_9MYCO|nr:hypothetical protein [Mycolicibacterium elephantis]MCV7223155.1 hypothetical protein [Mycolicibacterium elephantis]RWA22562.1 hypothetical protein MELE44368_12365 [Mycolicibacterium elephantis DSM 44368]